MTLAFEKHDHQHCQKGCLLQVEEFCQANGLRLTPTRRRVLEVLLMHHQAIGAYDLLNVLSREGFRAQPPVVYRALAFLTEHGFVHKIEQLNAYVACAFPCEKHLAAFFICRKCALVGETALEAALLPAQDFAIENQILEARGICKNCQE